MTWWTKKNEEWLITPDRVWVSANSGNCFAIRASYRPFGHDKPWEAVGFFHFYGAEYRGIDAYEIIPEWATKKLAKELTERYLMEFPEETPNLEYDEHDQSDDCEESLEISRRQELSSQKDRWTHGSPYPLCRDAFWRGIGAFCQVPGGRV